MKIQKCQTNLRHKIDNFRFSLAFVYKQLVEPLTKVIVDQLIPIDLNGLIWVRDTKVQGIISIIQQ